LNVFRLCGKRALSCMIKTIVLRTGIAFLHDWVRFSDLRLKEKSKFARRLSARAGA